MESVASDIHGKNDVQMNELVEKEYGLSLKVLKGKLAAKIQAEPKFKQELAADSGPVLKAFIEEASGKKLPDSFLAEYNRALRNATEGSSDELSDEDLEQVAGGCPPMLALGAVGIVAFVIYDILS